jgi:hypothetical protein
MTNRSCPAGAAAAAAEAEVAEAEVVAELILCAPASKLAVLWLRLHFLFRIALAPKPAASGAAMTRLTSRSSKSLKMLICDRLARATDAPTPVASRLSHDCLAALRLRLHSLAPKPAASGAATTRLTSRSSKSLKMLICDRLTRATDAPTLDCLTIVCRAAPCGRMAIV